MSWILVIMACQRVCTPTYAEAYPTKAACEVVVDKDQSVFHATRSYCIPVIEQGAKK